MQNYPLSELNSGTMYKCRLSNRPVLITSITEHEISTGKMVKSVTAVSVNPVNGYFDYCHPVFDYSLTDLIL